MGLGGVAIAVPPYVIHPKTAVLGRAGGMLMVFELLFLSYGKRLVRTNLSCTFQYERLPSVTVFPF